MARIIGQKLSDALGRQVVIDNRGGAGGNIGAEIAAHAAADGYTLFLGGVGSHGTNPGLQARLPYDPIKDFTPVTQIASASLVVTANLALPAKSIAELIKLAQARPGQINYASAGTGTIAHLSVELFNAMAGVRLQHVPYKGTGSALSDLYSGQVQLLFNSALSMAPLIRGNRVRGLAVTSATRIQPLPDLPTVAEAGVPGYEASSWQGLFGPAKIAPTIVDRLHRAVAEIAKTADIQKRLSAEGLVPQGSSPKEFEAFIVAEIQKWAKVTKAAGLSAK